MRNKKIINELVIWAIILMCGATAYNFYQGDLSFEDNLIFKRVNVSKKYKAYKHGKLKHKKHIWQNKYEKNKELHRGACARASQFITYVAPRDFSFFSLSEVLRFRTEAVKQCPIAPANYEPNIELFARIDSTRPWFITRGEHLTKDINLAAPIQNPIFLVDIAHPLAFVGRRPPRQEVDGEYRDFEEILGQCFKDLDQPPQAKYNKRLNSIEVYYPTNIQALVNLNKWKNIFPYQFALTGINARDFGYNYVEAISTKNIEMVGEKNITNTRYKFKDYFGKGSCSTYKGGARNNRLMPYQHELNFRITRLPAKFELMLYKNEDDKTGLRYVILFEDNYLHHARSIKDFDYDIKHWGLTSIVKDMTLEQYKEYYFDNYEKLMNKEKEIYSKRSKK